MKRLTQLALFVFFCGLVSACSPSGNGAVSTAAVTLSNLPPNVDVKTTAAVKNNPEVVVLDVREVFEYNEGHIPGVKLIPMNEVSSRLSEIPRDKTVIVTCRTGNRSSQVVNFLREKGYTRVHNMDGGIVAWQQAGLKVEK